MVRVLSRKGRGVQGWVPIDAPLCVEQGSGECLGALVNGSKEQQGSGRRDLDH